jgi:hypothetical protein
MRIGFRKSGKARSRLKHLKPAFGSIHAADFTSDDLKRYRAKRLKSEATRATINREVETLARAWNCHSTSPCTKRTTSAPGFSKTTDIKRYLVS